MADSTGPNTDGPTGGLILGFVALLVVLDLWAVHHFGLGIRNLAVPAGIAAALGGAIKLAGFVWDEATVRARVQSLTKPVQPFLARLVTPGVVTALAGLAAVLLISVSSVTVVDASGDGATVTLGSLERPDSERQKSIGPGGSTRFAVLTTPFGRLVRIDAGGYVGGTFTVFPPIGLRLQLGRDLASLPAVLFRPGPDELSLLDDGAEFRVIRATAAGDQVVASDTGNKGSFMLGRPRPITSDMVDDWTRQLQAAGAPPQAVADIVNAWKQARRLVAGVPLAAGEILRAEIRAGGEPLAMTEFALDGVGLIDVVVARTPR